MAKKILVVDDEPDMLKIVTFRLKKLGHEILTAVDGQEALDMIKDKRPDLVLLDLLLPIIDGYQVCKQVKNDETLKHIPIIFFTASGASNVAEKAKEMGADDFLVKPFDTEHLLQKVKSFIKED